MAHDLLGKQVSTFPDHALGLHYWAFIRRILRNASMTGICPFPRHYGLESDKKTHQVAWVGADGYAASVSQIELTASAGSWH
jgi:hypothetical protein